MAALPGVLGAAATGAIPTDDGGSDVRLLAPDRTASAQDEIGAQLVPVTAGFWDALGLPLVEGRAFTTSEAVDPQTTAVVVNRRLAATFWPGETAVGRSVRLVRGGEPLELRVIGVSPDLVYEEFGEVTPQSELNVYVPYAAAGWRTQALLVNVAPPADPGTLASAVRDAVRSIDSGVAVYDVQTMLERREYNHWGQQFVGRTMTVFAFAAVLLACVGTYGVISQGVAERRREIGVRLAIGATGGDIQRLFLGTGARLAAVGAAVGLPLAVLTAKALESLLFRVSPWDVAVWVTLPVALAAAMLLASYWPARRASEMEPGSILRIL